MLQWVPFFLGDYDRDTKDLTMEEDGAYFRLLRYVWATGNMLPHDIRTCERIANAHTDAEKHAIACVIDKFFIKKPGGFYHKKAMEVVAKQKAKSEKARQSANARHMRTHSERITNAHANEVKTHVLPEPDHVTIDPSDPIKPTAPPDGGRCDLKEKTKDPVWGDGLDILIGSGLTEANARTLLGKLVKLYTKQVVDEAITEVLIANPAQPRSYLTAILKKRGEVPKDGTAQNPRNKKLLDDFHYGKPMYCSADGHCYGRGDVVFLEYERVQLPSGRELPISLFEPWTERQHGPLPKAGSLDGGEREENACAYPGDMIPSV